jgi:HAD superfamily hydrolase (TIGR01490 family)
MKSIAFFDFDGTIIRRDSFPAFIIFSRGYIKFTLAAIWFIPCVIIARIFNQDQGKVKEKWFSFHFKGEDRAIMENQAADFIRFLQNSGTIRENIISTIKDFQKSGIPCVIVSASPDIWIKPFSNQYQMDYICTEVEINDEILSGRFRGKNCKGAEKKIRINKKYNLQDYDRIIAYGDSSGDNEMMSLATEVNWIR